MCLGHSLVVTYLIMPSVRWGGLRHLLYTCYDSDTSFASSTLMSTFIHACRLTFRHLSCFLVAIVNKKHRNPLNMFINLKCFYITKSSNNHPQATSFKQLHLIDASRKNAQFPMSHPIAKADVRTKNASQNCINQIISTI